MWGAFGAPHTRDPGTQGARAFPSDHVGPRDSAGHGGPRDTGGHGTWGAQGTQGPPQGPKGPSRRVDRFSALRLACYLVVWFCPRLAWLRLGLAWFGLAWLGFSPFGLVWAWRVELAWPVLTWFAMGSQICVGVRTCWVSVRVRCFRIGVRAFGG